MILSDNRCTAHWGLGMPVYKGSLSRGTTTCSLGTKCLDKHPSKDTVPRVRYDRMSRWRTFDLSPQQTLDSPISGPSAEKAAKDERVWAMVTALRLGSRRSKARRLTYCRQAVPACFRDAAANNPRMASRLRFTPFQRGKAGRFTYTVGSTLVPGVRSLRMSAQVLIVDGHSIIFAWPELRALHESRTASARDRLTKILTEYQDLSGTTVVLVFDGRGPVITQENEPGGIQVFYSNTGHTADDIVERLVAKYGTIYSITVATSDLLEQQTAITFGGSCISPEGLRNLITSTRSAFTRELKRRNAR